MSMEGKKGVDPFAGITYLNQLIITLEQAELKLEEAYKKNNPEQVRTIKEFILKVQKSIGDFLK